jgi:hypothetical protein
VEAPSGAPPAAAEQGPTEEELAEQQAQAELEQHEATVSAASEALATCKAELEQQKKDAEAAGVEVPDELEEALELVADAEVEIDSAKEDLDAAKEVADVEAAAAAAEAATVAVAGVEEAKAAVGGALATVAQEVVDEHGIDDETKAMLAWAEMQLGGGPQPPPDAGAV